MIEDWAVRVLDAEDGKEVRWFGGHVAPVTSYAFSPDGKRMASVATDRAARLWDLATGKTVAKLSVAAGRRPRGGLLRQRQDARHRL